MALARAHVKALGYEGAWLVVFCACDIEGWGGDRLIGVGDSAGKASRASPLQMQRRP